MRQLARAPSLRAPAIPAAAPVRAFGPVAAAPTAHDLSRVAVSAPAPRAPLGEAPIQRVIKLGGKALSDADVAELGDDDDEKAILSNWHKSAVEHDFSKSAKKDYLKQALGRAKAQPADAPNLFKPGNLRFLTQYEDRLPTLYFKTDDQGGPSGRLRQQHKHGPMVGTETKKTDYFFPTQQHKDDFQAAADQAHQDKKEFDPSALKNVEYSTEPYQGAHHLEVYWNKEKDKENHVYDLHPSQGTVVTNKQGYNDDTIKAMYKRIIGRAK